MGNVLVESTIYVQGALDAVIWDPEKGQPLAEFTRGLFETTDPTVMKKLDELGYHTIDYYGGVPPEEGFAPREIQGIIDVRKQDVKPAHNEQQELALQRHQQIADKIKHRIKHNKPVVADDDIEYSPPKNRRKKKSGKATKKR